MTFTVQRHARDGDATEALRRQSLRQRLSQDRGIHLSDRHLGDQPELDPEHEGRIIAEYGTRALANYYGDTETPWPDVVAAVERVNAATRSDT